MVPSVTKYVAKANKANCKADAATTLTQLQVNITDNYTEGTTAYTLPNTIGNASKATDHITTASGNPTYFATLDSEGTVTKFSYQHGKYTCLLYTSGVIHRFYIFAFRIVNTSICIKNIPAAWGTGVYE